MGSKYVDTTAIMQVIGCVFNKICNLCCQNKECMELIIFLALVGLGAIILLLWALLTAKDKNDNPKHNLVASK